MRYGYYIQRLSLHYVASLYEDLRLTRENFPFAQFCFERNSFISVKFSSVINIRLVGQEMLSALKFLLLLRFACRLAIGIFVAPGLVKLGVVSLVSVKS